MSNFPNKELKDYATSLADSVTEESTERALHAALYPSGQRMTGLRRRIITTSVTVLTFLTGNIGLAAAADSAIPGDALYGIDRGYERLADSLGVGENHAGERLEEAIALSQRGNVGLALDTAREGIENANSSLEAPGIAEALRNLSAASDRLNEPAQEAPGQSEEMTEAIQDVLDATETRDGNAISEAARRLLEVARSISDDARSSNPSSDPGSPSITAPGQSNNPGQGTSPDDVPNPPVTTPKP